MKNLNKVMILGAAMMAVSANAQFGATNKSQFSSDMGKSGMYAVYNPFTRATVGSASANGYSLAFDKLMSTNEGSETMLGGTYMRIDGGTLWQLHYRQYIAADASVQFAVIGGDMVNDKQDFSLLYFKDMPSQGENPLMFSLFGGVYRSSADNKVDLAYGVKASYPIQTGMSVDLTFFQSRVGGDTGNLITIGVGYKF